MCYFECISSIMLSQHRDGKLCDVFQLFYFVTPTNVCPPIAQPQTTFWCFAASSLTKIWTVAALGVFYFSALGRNLIYGQIWERNWVSKWHMNNRRRSGASTVFSEAHQKQQHSYLTKFVCCNELAFLFWNKSERCITWTKRSHLKWAYCVSRQHPNIPTFLY